MDKLSAFLLAFALSLLGFGAVAAQAARFPCCFARVASHGRPCAPVAAPARAPLLVSLKADEVSGS